MTEPQQPTPAQSATTQTQQQTAPPQSQSGQQGGQQGGEPAGGGEPQQTPPEPQSGQQGEPQQQSGGGGDTPVSREEFDRVMERMKAADRRASAAEQKVQEYEDANKSELERITAERDRATQDRDQLQQQLRDERIHNAFLSQTRQRWHNPDKALKLADLSGVEISDDGEVKGIKAAADALAKSDPYLVKPDDDGNPSGGNVGGGRRQGQPGYSEDYLTGKYPALRQ